MRTWHAHGHMPVCCLPWCWGRPLASGVPALVVMQCWGPCSVGDMHGASMDEPSATKDPLEGDAPSQQGSNPHDKDSAKESAGLAKGSDDSPPSDDANGGGKTHAVADAVHTVHRTPLCFVCGNEQRRDVGAWYGRSGHALVKPKGRGLATPSQDPLCRLQ